MEVDEAVWRVRGCCWPEAQGLRYDFGFVCTICTGQNLCDPLRCLWWALQVVWLLFWCGWGVESCICSGALPKHKCWSIGREFHVGKTWTKPSTAVVPQPQWGCLQYIPAYSSLLYVWNYISQESRELSLLLLVKIHDVVGSLSSLQLPWTGMLGNQFCGWVLIQAPK